MRQCAQVKKSPAINASVELQVDLPTHMARRMQLSNIMAEQSSSIIVLVSFSLESKCHYEPAKQLQPSAPLTASHVIMESNSNTSDWTICPLIAMSSKRI
jgi:hypothetical protein